MNLVQERAESGHSRNSSMNSMVDDILVIEQRLFKCINDGDRDELMELLDNEDTSDAVLKVILTTVYSNDNNHYVHDEEALQDADALLGPSTKSLNAIQIACMLGDEDISLELLEFINRITEELESKKLLFEFVGRIWGAGNTVLHLASFFGMADLVQRLLELGANPNKRNERQLRPVDCADDDKTLHVFSTVVAPEATRILQRSPSSDDSLMFSVLKTVNSFDDNSSVTSSLKRGMESRHVRPRSTSQLKEEMTLDERITASDQDKSISSRPVSMIRTIQKPKQLATIKSQRISKRKKIQFDAVSSIFYYCQYGEESDPFSTVNLATLLSENQSKLKQMRTGHQSLTPLHVACSYGQLKVVQMLLEEFSFPVNVFDKEGWTPLHCACVEGHVEVVELLCKCQGNGHDSRREHVDWFYVEDGPIDLIPLNDDDETPEDLIADKRPDETRALIKAWKRKFPPKGVSKRRPVEIETVQFSEDEKLESPLTSQDSMIDGKLQALLSSEESSTEILSPTQTSMKPRLSSSFAPSSAFKNLNYTSKPFTNQIPQVENLKILDIDTQAAKIASKQASPEPEIVSPQIHKDAFHSTPIVAPTQASLIKVDENKSIKPVEDKANETSLSQVNPGLKKEESNVSPIETKILPQTDIVDDSTPRKRTSIQSSKIPTPSKQRSSQDSITGALSAASSSVGLLKKSDVVRSTMSKKSPTGSMTQVHSSPLLHLRPSVDHMTNHKSAVNEQNSILQKINTETFTNKPSKQRNKPSSASSNSSVKSRILALESNLKKAV